MRKLSQTFGSAALGKTGMNIGSLALGGIAPPRLG